MQGVEKFEPQRLKLARQMYDDLSKAALAEMLNISPSTVTKWEDGTHNPQGEALTSIADAFQIPAHWFLRPMPNYGEPLFLNRANKRVFKAPCARSNAMLCNLAEVHALADEWVGFPKVDLPESLSRQEALALDNDRIQEITEHLRQHWGLGISPISNLVRRIERAGIVVAQFEIGYEGMDGTSAWINNKPYIFIALDKNNYYRSRFDLAHELGHLIMHRNLTHEDKKAMFDKLEDQAQYFASCLLFPIQAFTAEVGYRVSIDSLMVLKKRWGMSIAAMIYKARTLKMISEEMYTKLWRSYNYRGYKKSEPYDTETPVEQTTLLKNTIQLLLDQGGFDKANIIDKFGLKKHLELLAGLPKGFLNDDFGQIITIKPSIKPATPSLNSTFQGDIIKFEKSK